MDQPTTESQAPKSFGLYSGKAPLLIQVVGGWLWLIGIALLLQGLLWFLSLPLQGILSIVLGVFAIWCGRALFKMQRKGYVGALILQALVIIATGMLWGLNGFGKPTTTVLFGIGQAVFFILILYAYRSRFSR